MKRISLLALVVLPLAGCAALSDAFKPGPDGTVPAQTTGEAIAAAVAPVSPAAAGVIAAISLAVGAVAGRKTAPAKPAVAPPAV